MSGIRGALYEASIEGAAILIGYPAGFASVAYERIPKRYSLIMIAVALTAAALSLGGCGAGADLARAGLHYAIQKR